MINRKNRVSLIFAVWMVIGISWIWFRAPDCGTNYYPDYAEVVSYSDILSQYQPTRKIFFDALLLPSVVPVVVGLVLLWKARHVWLGLFLPLPLFCGCSLFMFGGMLCDGTSLHHVSTVEFDGSIYHLTLGYDLSSGQDVYTTVLFLFRCAADGEQCRGQEIVRRGYDNIYLEQPAVRIDVTLNRLQVTAGGEVVFVLNADSPPLLAPD